MNINSDIVLNKYIKYKYKYLLLKNNKYKGGNARLNEFKDYDWNHFHDMTLNLTKIATYSETGFMYTRYDKSKGIEETEDIDGLYDIIQKLINDDKRNKKSTYNIIKNILAQCVSNNDFKNKLLLLLDNHSDDQLYYKLINLIINYINDDSKNDFIINYYHDNKNTTASRKNIPINHNNDLQNKNYSNQDEFKALDYNNINKFKALIQTESDDDRKQKLYKLLIIHILLIAPELEHINMESLIKIKNLLIVYLLNIMRYDVKSHLIQHDMQDIDI